MDDDKYAGLSPEEIEAIKEDEPDDDVNKDSGDDVDTDKGSDIDVDEKDATEKDADKDIDTEKDADDNDSDDTDDTDDNNDNDDTTDDAGGDDNNDEDDDDDNASVDVKDKEEREQKPFTPTLHGVDKSELDTLKAALDAAKQKFDDGEIDYTEYSSTKDDYNYSKMKAEFTKESNKNLRDERWAWEQERFFEDNGKYKDNKTLNGAFIAVVNTIIATKEGNILSDKSVLLRAKKQVEEDLGLLVSVEQKKEPKNKEEKKAITASKKKRADTKNNATDIAGMPAAEENINKSPFEHIDMLDGEAFQAAINKMSPTQLRKFEDAM